MSKRKPRGGPEALPAPTNSANHAPANPARAMVAFAFKVHEEEMVRNCASKGRLRLISEIGADFTPREIRLRELGSALMAAAPRTGFPTPEVEARVKALEDAVMGVLKWELPNLWPPDQQSRSLHEYLMTQLNRLVAAIDPVRRLADCLDGHQLDKSSHAIPNERTEQPTIDALFKLGAIGLEGLRSIAADKRPTGERLAQAAIGRPCDGQFKATLAHMVDLEWLGNGRPTDYWAGTSLPQPGEALATKRR